MQNWSGMSLGWLRRIRRLEGRWASCNDVIRHLRAHHMMRSGWVPLPDGDFRTSRELSWQTKTREPWLGSFLWFETSSYGDVGLYLDNNYMLWQADGVPQLGRVNDYPFGPWTGWSPSIPDPDNPGQWLVQDEDEALDEARS